MGAAADKHYSKYEFFTWWLQFIYNAVEVVKTAKYQNDQMYLLEHKYMVLYISVCVWNGIWKKVGYLT